MIRRRRQLAAGAAALCVVALALLINGLSGGGLPRLPAPGLAGPGAAEALGVYDYVAAHRAAQGVPVSQVVWMICLVRENLWEYLLKHA